MDIFTVYALVLLSVSISAIGLFMFASDGYDIRHVLAGVASGIAFLAVVGAGIAMMAMGFNWFAAAQQANIINREYGTKYTQEEVFFASGVIDTIREIERSRTDVRLKIKQE